MTEHRAVTAGECRVRMRCWHKKNVWETIAVRAQAEAAQNARQNTSALRLDSGDAAGPAWLETGIGEGYVAHELAVPNDEVVLRAILIELLLGRHPGSFVHP